MESPKIKKIIFDLDNTLLFISSNWNDYYQRLIDKYNFKTTPEELYSTIGSFERNNVDKIITKDYFIKYINEKLPINFTEEILENFLRNYADIPLLNLDIITNVLTYLSQKYELIVYSNWFAESQVLRLRKNNLLQFFTKIYGDDTLPIKPSKRGLEKLIGDDNIEDFVFIGDDISIDLEMPQSIGMDTIFYNRKNIEQDKYREIHDIEELIELL